MVPEGLRVVGEVDKLHAAGPPCLGPLIYMFSFLNISPSSQNECGVVFLGANALQPGVAPVFAFRGSEPLPTPIHTDSVGDVGLA